MSRLADVLLTCVGLVLLSPLLIALFIIVRLDSPGPVIYRRRVMGKGGAQFDAFKFRTMLVNGDEMLAKYPEAEGHLGARPEAKGRPTHHPLRRVDAQAEPG